MSETQELEHKLVAVLSADVVNYSALMAQDEIRTIRLLSIFRAEIEGRVRSHDGRVVDFVGDNMLAEFRSAIDSVRGAIAIQTYLRQQNERYEPSRRMELRIGLHLGDVVVQGERIYGDGVNIAARLEGLALPGGICLSSALVEQVRGRLPLRLEPLGPQRLKNLPEPVVAYRWSPTPSVREEIPGAMPVRRPQAGTAESLVPLSSVPEEPTKPSLLVLPFWDLTPEKRYQYFADGLYMDVMTELVRIPSLFLVSEISALSLRKSSLPLSEMAGSVGARYVLEAGIRCDGENLRLSAQLTDTESRRKVWAERYDTPLTQLGEMQDELVREIITALDVKLITGEWAGVLRRLVVSRETLEAYYRGWEALMRSGKGDLMEAARRFADLSRLEPDSGVGWALRAWTEWLTLHLGYADDEAQQLQLAEELAREANRREDITGIAHLVLAHTLLLKGHAKAALDEADRAVQQRPSCDASFVIRASILDCLGRSCEAAEVAEYALRLSPMHPAFYLSTYARALYRCGRLQEAEEASRRVLQQDPRNLDALVVRLCTVVEQGRRDEAQELARMLRALHPEFSLEYHERYLSRAAGKGSEGEREALRSLGF